jgi:hypothetical protein
MSMLISDTFKLESLPHLNGLEAPAYLLAVLLLPVLTHWFSGTVVVVAVPLHPEP